jgi:flagellar basal-body rod modification protein FlgD
MTSVDRSSTSSGSIFDSLNRPSSSGASTSTDAQRFLTLLTAQMQNQDPLNPLDNAQVTSQLAQISTVTGITQLNESVSALTFSQLRTEAFAATSMIGKSVLVQSDKLGVKSGVAAGALSLDVPAKSVNVEVLDRNGKVVDTIKLGPKEKGIHDFTWKAPKGSEQRDYRFRIQATSADKKVPATPLVRSEVTAVSFASSPGGSLVLANGVEAPVAAVWRLQ